MSNLAGAVPRLGEYIPAMKPGFETFEGLIKAHRGRTFADIKYDGYRMQVHRSKSRFWIFTSNGNELNYACHPEITKIVERLPVCIIETELAADGANHNESYEKVKKRFRTEGISEKAVNKYLNSGIISEAPLHLRLFDTLRFERRGLLHLPLEQRNDFSGRFDIKGLVPVESQEVTTAAELESLVEATFKAGHEGRVCKDPDSLYIPGGRTLDWVKYKRSEPLDLVIVGFYTDKDYAGELPFTSVLVAAYNDETRMYETMGKIGTTREGIAHEIFAKVRGCMSSSPPEDVVFSGKLNTPKFAAFVPDRYVSPGKSVVLEVRALGLHHADNWQSCGLEDGKAFSMRIGYAKQLRPDKDPHQATTTGMIRKLYDLQKRVRE
jgi:ATP-dependent DNA ligase